MLSVRVTPMLSLPRSRIQRGELDAHRRRHAERLARRRQGAGLLVDAEADDRVGALIARQQESAGRVDAEIARRLALR